MPRITANDFLNAFREQWSRAVKDDHARVSRSYCGDSTWTEFMLDGDKSLLRRVAESLSMRMVPSPDVQEKEWYKWDCIYYKGTEEEGRQPWFPANPMVRYGNFPAYIEAVIEHENKKNVEQEMYKLLMLIRSPLKVLIMYDEYPVLNGLTDKLTELLSMGVMADSEWPEAIGTEYLFLIGKLAQGEAMPCWRYMIASSGQFGARMSPEGFLRHL